MPNIYVKNPIGIRLREKRIELGMSQKDLALATGKQQSLICKHERGQLKPSGDTLTIYARALGVSERYLTGESDDERVS